LSVAMEMKLEGKLKVEFRNEVFAV
jgi:hypothetical protein